MTPVFLDVSTRWKSSFMMLDRAIMFGDAFRLLEEDGFLCNTLLKKIGWKHNNWPPNSEDLENCFILCRFLRVKLKLPKSLLHLH